MTSLTDRVEEAIRSYSDTNKAHEAIEKKYNDIQNERERIRQEKRAKVFGEMAKTIVECSNYISQVCSRTDLDIKRLRVIEIPLGGTYSIEFGKDSFEVIRRDLNTSDFGKKFGKNGHVHSHNCEYNDPDLPEKLSQALSYYDVEIWNAEEFTEFLAGELIDILDEKTEELVCNIESMNEEIQELEEDEER